MKSSSVFCSVSACALLALASPAAVHAQELTYAFNIPARDLGSGLRAYAQITRQQLAFDEAVARGKRTKALVGQLSGEQALLRLLAGTGLVAQKTTSGVFIIREAAGPVLSDAAMSPREEPQGALLQRAALRSLAQADAAPAGFSSTPVPAAQPPGQLEEVVVTAARQTQNLQKVSAAVQVVSGATLTSEGLTNIAEIVANLPSLQATGQPGGFSIDIRGLGGDLPAGSTQGSVALEFDGVYNINSQSTTVGFFDVDRIEVLPGPQSTRYGPDADGGVVNVITKDPILGQWSGLGSLTVGGYGLVRAEVAQNVPISERLALRIAAAVIKRNSYFTPAVGNLDAQSLRAKLLYRATDKLDLKLEYQLDHIGGTGNGSNVFPVFTNKVPIYSSDSINDHGDPWKHGDVQAPGQGQDSTRANVFQHTLVGNLSYTINDAVALDVLASYSRLSGGETSCLFAPPWSTTPGGPFPICGAKAHEFDPFYQYSDEVRLHNAPGAAVQWNIGFYHWNYLWRNFLTDALFFSGPPTQTTSETNALFGEVTYPVTDRLRLIGGLRKSYDYRTFNFANGPSVTPVFGIHLDHFDYRVGVEYDLGPASMAYLTASTGYRPGGLSSFNPLANKPNSFDSETNTAIELGSKNRFLDNRLQINGDVFYYVQEGYQNLDKYNGFFINVNGAQVQCTNQTQNLYAGCTAPTWNLGAHSLGFELQSKFNVTEDDLLGFTGTWLHATFDKNQGTCGTVGINAGVPGYSGPGCYDGYNDMATDQLKVYNMAGAVQPHSPKFSGNFTYSHRFHLASGAQVSVGGNAYYSTGYWLNPVEDSQFYGWQPAYWMEGLNAAFTPAAGDWSINVYVHNLSNYAVKQSVLPATSIGEPRNIGVVLTKHW